MESHQYISSGLGMKTFPAGTEEPGDLGDHVMGVVVMAWLTGFCVDQWGESWMERGGMSTRFRSHLTTGLTLKINIERSPQQMDFSIEDQNGVVMATATATAPLTPSSTGLPTNKSHSIATAGTHPKLKPSHETLLDQPLAPMDLSFDAERDLYFVPELTDGTLWQDRGWAHPSWLASSTNALVRRTIDFKSPQQWLHAGLSYQQFKPIESGDIVILSGTVERLFDGGQRRFATCDISATVQEHLVATVKNTFAYGSIEP